MKILVDCQPIQGLTRKGGIGRYTHCLLNALALNSDIQLLLMINKALPEPKNISLLQEKAKCIYWYPLTPSRYQYLEEQWAYHCNELIRQAVITENAPNVVLICSHFDGFGENNISPTFYPSDTPHIILIHDLIHLLNLKRYLQNEPLKAFYLQKIAFLQQAHSIFTISEATRADVLNYLKLDSKKVFNIGTGAPTLAVTDDTSSQNFTTLHENPLFLLYVANGDLRKNHELLVDLAAKLHKEGLKVQIVCAGELQAERLAKLKRDRAREGLSAQHITFTGYINDNSLAYLYSKARALVFPSHLEGFGLPIAEALTFNLPVIATDSISSIEILKERLGLFPDNDLTALFSLVKKLLTEPAFEKTLKKISELAVKKLNWSDVCNLLMQHISSELISKPKLSDQTAGDLLVAKLLNISIPNSIPPNTNDYAKLANVIAKNLPGYLR